MDGQTKALPTLNDLLDFAETAVRKWMIKDGGFTPMIHAVTGAGEALMFVVPDYGGLHGAEKIVFCAALGRLMRDKGCIMYVLLWEAWATPSEAMTPEIAARLVSGAPPPREEAGREERVFLAACDTVGDHRVRAFKTMRDGDGKVVDLQARPDDRMIATWDAEMMRLLVREPDGRA